MNLDDKKYKIEIDGEGYKIVDNVSKKQLSKILAIITYGDEFLPNENLTSINNTKSSTKKRRKNIQSTPVKVRHELEELDIDPVSNIYGNYWTIKTKSDKLMWILALLNENNIESANQKEISYIAEKLGDNIPVKSITALLDAHKKNGRIVPSLSGTTRTIRILKPGLDYIKNLFTLTEK